MRTIALISLVAASSLSLYAGSALAKKPKKEPLLEQPCPIDESLRLASGQSISRYSLLANCTDKIIVAPATEEEARSTVRIVPRYIEVDTPMYESGQGNSDYRDQRLTPVANAGGVTDILSLRPASYRTPFDATIQDVAQRHRVDPLLLHAVILQESGYRKTIRSSAGAVGLMQIMPATGASLGVATADLVIPESNVDAGARLLKRLYYKYSGNFPLVLAAYNAGEGAVQKYGNQVPPFTETQNYVKRVLAHYDRLVADATGGGAHR